MDVSEIVYQNKDVTAKSLAELFKGKTFSVYGIDVSEIVDVEPTNLPEVEANELRLDNLFRLKDGSYAIVDYESSYNEENKIKYLGYIARVAKRIYNDHKRFIPIRMIIIYTADVNRGKTVPELDLGVIKMELTEAFLIEQDSKTVYNDIEAALDETGELSDEDTMRLIAYPLTFKGNTAKREAIERVIRLLDKIAEDESRRFVAKYLLAFTDKVINKAQADELRRIVMLTKVEQIIENEKIEAVNAAVNNTRKEDREEARREMARVVERLLRKGDEVSVVSECTGFSIDDVKKIQDGILQEA